MRYRASDQNVLSLAQGLEACASLGLGVMLDFKLRRDGKNEAWLPPSVSLVERTAALLRRFGLGGATVTICGLPLLREHLADLVLFPIGESHYLPAVTGAEPLDGQYCFTWARSLPDETVRALHERGLFIIASINTFHYPAHAHRELARQDIERLLAAGVEGFQIDSVYEDCFEGIGHGDDG